MGDNNIERKVLNKLKEKGWEDSEIKYSPFRILVKGDFGLVYNTKTDSVICKYYRGNDIRKHLQRQYN